LNNIKIECKIVVPQVTGRVLDRAIQVYGAEGMCQDQLLAEMYAQSRTLRIADGPDEVHQLYPHQLESSVLMNQSAR
jgi:alkylation response protein AidB-like acyl-CoA dehydrogenase